MKQENTQETKQTWLKSRKLIEEQETNKAKKPDEAIYHQAMSKPKMSSTKGQKDA